MTYRPRGIKRRSRKDDLMIWSKFHRGGGGLRHWASCLLKWGELSINVGRVVFLSGASCLLKVGRVVLGRVLCGASCLGASCLWGELS